MGVAKSNGRAQSKPSPRRRPAHSSASTKSLKFKIDSDFAQGRAVQDRLLEEIKQHGFDNHACFAIKLALDEALINAIKHGNKLDAGKKVRVEAKINSKKVEITVEDQGPGFNRTGVPDPTVHDNLCKSTGRGILLMESYMNSVKWSKNGRCVRMTKLKK
ncbi:MAG TPA: ATP-binding protein [Tepidisphaeraceae bacterium]|jgi:serine/threonine-protein kinase RsbW|nr:ATP-binding protein [Tepidisphaeraceae bacterium]